MTTTHTIEAHLQTELGKVIFGAHEAIHALAIALIARGHLLFEGPPGLGKTLLSRSFAQVLGGDFRRVQGTADLMPSDITGVHVFNTEHNRFEFQQGPVFADVLLVDEINRAGPKTQSALLEAMEEHQVTIDRETFSLADDFLVVATQNPREYEGTYPLPESQLDRFMLGISVSYPDPENEARVIETYNLPGQRITDPGHQAITQLPRGTLVAAREELKEVALSAELIAYVLDIAAATRSSTSLQLGLSTRGALALARCARVEAALRGADYVIPDDVKRIAPWVMTHRLVLAPDAALAGTTADQVIQHILDAVPVER